jgi:hypothetical protein
VSRPLLFLNYVTIIFLLTVCKMYLTTVSMTIFVGCTVKKSNGLLTPPAAKKLNLFFVLFYFIFNCVIMYKCLV